MTTEAAQAATRALASSLPVWISGGPGRGAYSVARALHHKGNPIGLCSVRRPLTARELEERITATAQDTDREETIGLYVETIEIQPEETQELILRLIDEGFLQQRTIVPVRAYLQSDRQLLAGTPRIIQPLRLRLMPLHIQLPRLDERANELPEICRTLSAMVAKRLGKESPARTEEEWTTFATASPGIEELESRILTDCLESIPATPAQPENRIVPSTESTESTRPIAEPEPTPVAVPEQTPALPELRPRFQLEAVLNELAHEFKNPMVTIKTFAQHLDRLIGDEELRERFSKLTLDAVARMDGFLEEILRYSHFGRPEKQLVSLRDAVEQALTSSDSELCERIQWNGTRPQGSVPADQEQLVFALRLLFRGFSRELPARAPVLLTSGPNGEFVIRAPMGSPARKLQSHVSEGSQPESETSLHFAIATDLVQRNGGDLRLVRNPDTFEALLTFPSTPAQ